MIIVDTCVWIEAYRQPTGPDARALYELLDAGEVVLALPVRVEYLAAARRKDRAKLSRLLTALPLAIPERDTWRTIEKWASKASEAGYSFGIPDLLIGALAEELVGLVWSHDKDFAAMEKLGFVHLY